MGLGEDGKFYNATGEPALEALSGILYDKDTICLSEDSEWIGSYNLVEGQVMQCADNTR